VSEVLERELRREPPASPAAPPPPAAGRPSAAGAAAAAGVSDLDFARFQALINREAGIWLSPVKKALLVGRLARRLRELGLGSWHQYYQRVTDDLAERIRMLDAITTNETHFFREPRHWEHLAERVFPAWQAQADEGRRPRRLRVWSAACSTGEEPYTIAMMLLGAFPSGWDLEVQASDLSTRVLERAERAVWPVEKAAEIPEAYLKAFMLRGEGTQAGLMRAGPELRALCRFSRLNLATERYPAGPFDLIFCRNVLIYFDRDTKERVIDQLVDRLMPDGLLFLGHAETLAGYTTRARPALPTVYTRSAGGRAARAEG
jgi:chemotaxis protein methyltransferase CheR